MFWQNNKSKNHVEVSVSPASPLTGYYNAYAEQARRESQIRAVAHTMNRTLVGHVIRTWSMWFFVILATHIAVYIGVAKQDLRPDLYLAGSTMQRVNFLYITFTAFAFPFVCSYFLRTLAAALAGQLLGERGYTVPGACLLLTANLKATLSLSDINLLLYNAEKGVRKVIVIRLIGDYIVKIAVPFISLAVHVRAHDDKCWMNYDWSWLLFVLLWPSLWSLVVLVYLMQYWGSEQCARAGATGNIPAVLQAALDLSRVIKDAEGDVSKLSGRWKQGHRVTQGDGVIHVDQAFLGLVREEECISLTDMLLTIEREDGVMDGKIVQV